MCCWMKLWLADQSLLYREGEANEHRLQVFLKNKEGASPQDYKDGSKLTAVHCSWTFNDRNEELHTKT